MKLAPRDAAAYLASPDASKAGLLIYGADPMRVALKRQQVIAALIGPDGDAEMRLARMSGGDLRKDPAQLLDAVQAVGFFAGPRVAFVEEATDGLAPVIANALAEWRDGDAQIIVTAAALNARSALRKAFEGHANAYALGVYDDPPSRAEIEQDLARAGLKNVPREPMDLLTDLSRRHDPGEFRQILEKLALFKMSDGDAVTIEEIEACTPSTFEAEADDVVNAAAEARREAIGPLMRRLSGQGVQPVSICITALRHFRNLHRAASDPGGVSSGMARLRPQVFGPRRDRMERQARRWGMHGLEQAIALLVDTDLVLRSSQKAPAAALLERNLIRLAIMGGRQT